MKRKVCRTYKGLLRAINNGEENVVLRYKDKSHNKVDYPSSAYSLLQL